MKEDYLSVHVIMGFFLFLVLIETSRYLFQVFGFRGHWIRIPLPIFFLLVVGIGGVSSVLLLSLGPKEALLALALGGGIGVSLFHPMAAISIFMAALLIRPWETFQDNAVMDLLPRLLAATAMGSWLLSRFLRRQMSFVWTRGLTIFTLLFAWLIISALISPYSDQNFDFIFKTFLPIYVVCILIVNSVETEQDLGLLERSLTLSLTGVIAVAILMTVSNPLFFVGRLRLKGPGLTGNSNDLAAIAVLALPFLLIQAIQKLKKRGFPALNLACIGVLLLGLLMTKSRAGLMAFAAMCVLYLFLFSKSRLKLFVWISVSLPFLAALMEVAMQRKASDLEGSSESRMNYIFAAFRMLKAHPLLGVGVGNYPRFYERYTDVFIETGMRTAHSTWALFLAETGPIGFTLFAVLFFSAAGKAWQMRKTHPEFIMSVLAYGIPMSVLSHSYAFFPYFLIFLVLSAYRVVEPSDA